MNIDTHGSFLPSIHSHEEHLALPGGYDLRTTDGNILHRHPLWTTESGQMTFGSGCTPPVDVALIQVPSLNYVSKPIRTDLF